jgi:Flp pilus assembly protein TadD
VTEEAKAAIPGNREIGQLLAQLYMQTRQTDKAVAQYESLIKANPRDDMAANNLAMLLTAKADPASLDRASQLAERFESSTQPAFLDTIGWVHYLKGDYDKALPLLQKAVDLAPKAPELQYHLGMALYKTGQVDQAKRYLKQALEAKVEFPGLDEARKIMAQG